ncbi:hypothetical protein MLD38_038361 [Melastoma candidum]|uniref:Uncharacterized protein n=1 Tax=Melastoma candidum TaxID=119954 RepID=A0ACB9KZB5_9MYRT|nr:hypothetical protein MLD38_038361 [Melastoma candidum]
MMKLSERFTRPADLAGHNNHSQLLDHFERISLEAHLNQAILLGRSLSGSGWPQPQDAEPPTGSSSSGIRRAVKKLLSPIFGRKSGARDVRVDSTNPVPRRRSCSDSRKPIPGWCSYSQTLSRSMRA